MGLLATIIVTVFVTRLARTALAKKIGGNETMQSPAGYQGGSPPPLEDGPGRGGPLRLPSRSGRPMRTTRGLCPMFTPIGKILLPRPATILS